MTISRSDIEDQRWTLSEGARYEIEQLRRNGELEMTYAPIARCHVCCEPDSYDLVNTLIAKGCTNRYIAESCEAINARRREKGDDRIIKAVNVWKHRRNHFNVENPAQRLYAEIVERRAEQANLDWVNGVGHALTTYAVLETIMVKGYGHLVAKDSEPPTVRETLDSAIKLHELTNKDADQRKMADLIMQMDRILSAVMEEVPEEYHEAILAKVEGREMPKKVTPSQRVTESARQALREFTPPTISTDEDF